MNNPEFKRNLWLELSMQRLILMPAVLIVIGALTIYLSSEGDITQTLLIVFSIIGMLLAGAWGSFAAVESINSEISERTWDQQRLSALSPWQMAWGKLLGASIYSWFGAAICAIVVLVNGIMGNNPPRVILLLIAAILGCLALHSWLMAARLHTMDVNIISNSSLIKRLFGIFVLLQLAPGIIFLFIGQQSTTSIISWWGLPLGFSSLCLLVTTLALALGLLALWRSMSAQLMVRTIPWAWALGCTAWGLIIAGFIDDATTPFLWTAIVANTALLATYFTLFTEKNNSMVWRSVIFYAHQKEWRRVLQTIPLWPVSWLLMLVFTLLYTLFAGLSPRAVSPGLTEVTHWYSSQLRWMALLHALRDAGIYLFFAWSKTTRKPVGMALLTYAVLGYVLPMFFGLGSGSALAQVFEPMYGFRSNGVSDYFLFSPWAWFFMTLHLAIIAMLLSWRWKRSVQLQQA